MAGSLSPLSLSTNLRIYRQTDFIATGAADHDDIFDSGGASTPVLLKIDNTANAAATSYACFYNAVNPTIGTTAPDIVIPVVGGATVNVAIHRATAIGTPFATGLSIACKTAGGTAGTTAPTSDVVLTAVGQAA